jgi:nucleotide-binding universal stress UspA family protein
MVDDMSSGTIVVGVDGSAGSERALLWAAEEARLRGAKLHVVHAWNVPLSVGLPDPSVLGHTIVPEVPLDEIRAVLASKGQAVLDAALESVEAVDVAPELVEALPAHALVRAAEDADLLVVGSRGLGGFKELLLGSVGHQCAHHAPCPIVIVPPPPGT